MALIETLCIYFLYGYINDCTDSVQVYVKLSAQPYINTLFFQSITSTYVININITGTK
jgi:hypothetical protein